MTTAAQPQLHEAIATDAGIGHTIRLVREQRGYSQRDAASRIGVSQRTWVKIEHDDESVALASYRRAVESLGLAWLFEAFQPARDDSLRTPERYLTGSTALTLTPPDGPMPALWYTEGLSNPNSWRIAGRDLVSTQPLLGCAGLWDATRAINQYGFTLPQVWAATPERAIFDLLIHYCECRGKPVPNVQASDIDDVVQLDQVKAWLEQCRPFLSERGLDRMAHWLEGGY